MVSEIEKQEFLQRVSNLKLNVDALEEVRVAGPGNPMVIPNADKKRNSLQIYAAITTNDGYISPDSARKGLDIFGEGYIREWRNSPTEHPSIGRLVNIIESDKRVRSDVVRRESVKMHPFSDDVLKKAAEIFGTPVIVYDEATIRSKMRRLKSAFSGVPKFMNHIAVKATDCAPIIQIAIEEEMGVDCASAKELHMSRIMGIPGYKVMLTSNATPARLFKQARDMGAIINLDDITHINYFQRKVGELPKLVSLRYNPGDKMVGGDRIIGEPGEQKYGAMYDHMVKAIRLLREGGVEEFGLHQMIVSNELNENNLIDSARHLLDLENYLSDETGVKFKFANLGGGLGIGYKPEQISADEFKVGQGIANVYRDKLSGTSNYGLEIKMENGRWLTADSGVLLMEALHLEQKPSGLYVKVDAGGNDFARVEAYGSYHHINVLGKTGHSKLYNVAGPKCENSDHWAKNRLLPEVEEGDILALCGAGAHGHMMGSSYNGFPRCGEVLFKIDGTFEMMTRPETLKDQFAKYNFPGSNFMNLANVPEFNFYE